MKQLKFIEELLESSLGCFGGPNPTMTNYMQNYVQTDEEVL